PASTRRGRRRRAASGGARSASSSCAPSATRARCTRRPGCCSRSPAEAGGAARTAGPGPARAAPRPGRARRSPRLLLEKPDAGVDGGPGMRELLLGVSLGLGAGLSPGPLLSLVISASLRGGFLAGLRMACVPFLSDLPVVLLTTTVVGALPETLVAALSVAGGLYVIHLGVA